MGNDDSVGHQIARIETEFAKELATEIVTYATLMRTGPAVSPKMRDVPLTTAEHLRTSQVIMQVILELQEGTIEDLYQHLDPFVTAQHAKRKEWIRQQQAAERN